MKKITFATILFFGVVSSSNAIKLDILTGDTKLACEAMLCLASPVKPPECGAALARYFSIDARKWADVIAKRRSFLNLCPVDASSDPEMYKYKNDILVHLDGECSVSALNNRVEDTLLRTETIQKCSHGDGCTTEIIKHYGYRINPQLTNSCRLLASSKYTDYHLKYTCNTKFYEKRLGKRLWVKRSIARNFNALPISQREQGEKLIPVSYAEFVRLPADKRKQGGFGKYYRVDIAFYQKIIIKKDCWINEK